MVRGSLQQGSEDQNDDPDGDAFSSSDSFSKESRAHASEECTDLHQRDDNAYHCRTWRVERVIESSLVHESSHDPVVISMPG